MDSPYLTDEIVKAKYKNSIITIVTIYQFSGVETIFQWGRDRDGAATRKLPTPKFKFLLGSRSLHYENTYAKQIKILKYFKHVLF